ncbi:MAG: SPOR domain-containing protein [Saprospiraceae bacterium]
MKNFFLFLSCTIFFCSLAQAQGQVAETVDPKVARLMQTFIENNKAAKTIKGWRIQILASTDRQRVENALYQFQALYPNVPADWVHAKPYYKIRAGAFISKREALRTLYILKQDYPAAYPVQDNNIKPEELLH